MSTCRRPWRAFSTSKHTHTHKHIYHNLQAGQLRYIQAAVERFSGKVQLVLVWNARDFRAAAPLAQLLVFWCICVWVWVYIALALNTLPPPAPSLYLSIVDG